MRCAVYNDCRARASTKYRQIATLEVCTLSLLTFYASARLQAEDAYIDQSVASIRASLISRDGTRINGLPYILYLLLKMKRFPLCRIELFYLAILPRGRQSFFYKIFIFLLKSQFLVSLERDGPECESHRVDPVERLLQCRIGSERPLLTSALNLRPVRRPVQTDRLLLMSETGRGLSLSARV